ncbi:putative mitochondrial leucine-rich repeat protein (LRRP) [Leptomonas pyrrhocoris]|uniref:Putative mitochondrial leucine-rich repeat protein (LRRP) n=1 Tax=Leptomonas pyrrhocoris TaxID=157538 RepID=A0A0N0DTY8_LEPPY|nr:putative mitochondrial leucine-rich repeat protein (LRRP) [Leptomonas pyrrhocoris]KPA78122.1 putative mitochondrial leucine-rich repeat protein (LRRP) [Leptomonas pyrrhocoris]|eukprot:XP_015656561.1 putative mitochondrial leucine-rich repeat protein (LRRP) [Leptomonas pyrrhocoris]
MRALRLAWRPPPPAAASLAASSLCQARRRWSLAALLQRRTRADLLLESVRQAAAFSADWDVDFSAITERGAAAGCYSLESQSQLIGRVGAALAHVLTSPQQQASAPCSSSAVAAPGPYVRTLRLTLPTPEAALTLAQLAQTTPLLSAVTSVELTVESGAISVAQDSMEGTGGQEVTELLHVLARRSAQQPSWVDLSLFYREAASSNPLHSSSSSSSSSSGDDDMRSTGSSLVAPCACHRSLWDDAAVTALAALVDSKPWQKIALTHVVLTGCTPRTRLTLWAAYEKSCTSLVELHLNGTQPARELISTGLLRRFSKLTSVDVGRTQLEEDAVVKLLRDLHEGGNGWWHLRLLGLAQCEFTDAAVDVMAEQLREGQAQQQQQQRQRQAPTILKAVGEAGPAGSPEDTEGDVALTSFDISGARLSRTAVFTLAGCLVPCTALIHLNTRHCRLQADGVEHLAAALQHATGLRTWVLCLNRLADEGMAALAKYGKYWPNLRGLDLTRCRLTCVGVNALSTAVPAWDSLEVLRLVGSDLRCPQKTCTPPAGGKTQENDSGSSADGGNASTGLFAYDPAFMKGHGSSAKVPTSYELDRRDRAEGRRRYRGTEAFIEAAAPAAQRQGAHTPLERLGASLALCLRLRLLDLSDCSLADEGLHQLTLHFTGGGTLEELRLAANPLFTSVRGLDALVGLLGRTPHLTSLDLSFTGLGDLGVSMLCDGTSGAEDGVLASMGNLMALELTSCAVHALGWESLAAALPRWPALRHVALNYNAVSEVELLRSFLRQLAAAAPALQSVSLMGCVADPRVVQRLIEAEEYRVLLERGVHVHL